MKFPSDMFLSMIDSQGFDLSILQEFAARYEDRAIRQYQEFLKDNPKLAGLDRRKYSLWVGDPSEKIEVIRFFEFSHACSANPRQLDIYKSCFPSNCLGIGLFDWKNQKLNPILLVLDGLYAGYVLLFPNKISDKYAGKAVGGEMIGKCLGSFACFKDFFDSLTVHEEEKKGTARNRR